MRIEDLTIFLDAFRRIFAGAFFFIYDSYDNEGGRIIVFSIHKNLKILFKSDIRHLNGTFRIVPSIFFQQTKGDQSQVRSTSIDVVPHIEPVPCRSTKYSEG